VRLEPAPATPGIHERSVLAAGGVSKSKQSNSLEHNEKEKE
jgi:hypothetical protein